MGVWVVIPVKPLKRSKTRLAQVLPPEQRQSLAEQMLRHVLGVVRSVPQLMGTLVISRDNKALTIAREYGARTVQESGQPELNAALMRATQVARRFHADAVLILPADLPMLTANDVQQVLALGQQSSGIVIASDQNHDGTNALLVRPPGAIEYSYGPGSYERHIGLARLAGVDVQVYESSGLSLDIDVPADLAYYNALTDATPYQNG